MDGNWIQHVLRLSRWRDRMDLWPGAANVASASWSRVHFGVSLPDRPRQRRGAGFGSVLVLSQAWLPPCAKGTRATGRAGRKEDRGAAWLPDAAENLAPPGGGPRGVRVARSRARRVGPFSNTSHRNRGAEIDGAGVWRRLREDEESGTGETVSGFGRESSAMAGCRAASIRRFQPDTDARA